MKKNQIYSGFTTEDYLVEDFTNKTDLFVKMDNQPPLQLSKFDKNYISAIHNKKTDEYLSEEIIFAKIIEIEDKHIVTKCLLDKENRIYQKRIFDKEPFIGIKNLNSNDIIEIKIFTKSGERKYTYRKTDNSMESIFSTKQNIFSSLESTSIFKPLPSDDEDNF